MNVTGKESRRYDAEELRTLSKEAEERKAPRWVVDALREQADEG